MDAAEAEWERFLGSPTFCAGRDIERGVRERCAFVLACRVYRGEVAPAGPFDERRLRHALETAR